MYILMPIYYLFEMVLVYSRPFSVQLTISFSSLRRTTNTLLSPFFIPYFGGVVIFGTIHDYGLSIKQDVNASNVEKNTPLHWACLNGHIEVIIVTPCTR